MGGNDRAQRAYWDKMADIDPDASIIDPRDWRGLKNAYLAGIRDSALSSSLSRHGVHTGTLLDLGCGTGSSTHPLLEAGYSMLGVDISPGLLRHARNRCGDNNCLFIATDGEALPVLESTLDAAIVYVVLSYLVDDAKAQRLLESVRRALRPGAPLLLIEQARTRRRVTEQGLKVQRSQQEWLTLLRSSGYTIDRFSILRHGRFPATPLIAAGAVPRKLWPYARTLESRIASWIGVFPWDYAEILFEATA